MLDIAVGIGAVILGLALLLVPESIRPSTVSLAVLTLSAYLWLTRRG